VIVDRRRPVLTGIGTGDCWVILAGVSDMIVPNSGCDRPIEFGGQRRFSELPCGLLDDSLDGWVASEQELQIEELLMYLNEALPASETDHAQVIPE
jgi:hypothetical protein